MFEPVLISSGLKVLFVLFALLLLWAYLRWLDRRAGLNFRSAINLLETDANALARYLGLRFLGACLFFGLVVAFS